MNFKQLCIPAAAAIVFPLFAVTMQDVNTQIKAKKWSEAETMCRELIKEVKTPKDKFYAYMKLMLTMRRQNKHAELVKDAESFLADCTDDKQAAELLIYKGIGLRDTKQYEAGLEAFQQAFDRAKEGRAALEAAYYYIDIASSFGMKQYGKAQNMYQQVSKCAGADKDARLLNAAAYAHYADKKNEEALLILAKTDSITTVSPAGREISLRYRGNALYNLKRYEEAVKSFDQALTLKLGDYIEGRLLWSKAYALEKLGDKAGALECFKKASEYKGDAYFQRDSFRAVKRLSK